MNDEKAHDLRKIDPSVGGTVFERYFTGKNEANYVAPNTIFMTTNYVNLVAFETLEGLILVDTGMVEAGATVLEEIRKLTKAPLHTVIFTHGHMDHYCSRKRYSPLSHLHEDGSYEHQYQPQSVRHCSGHPLAR